MAKPQLHPGQIWKDDCYYFDATTGECKRKYVLVLAVDHATGDCVTMVFTSKPNGLTENPKCSLGPPRAGYFVSNPGAPLNIPTWVDFSSVETLESSDLDRHIASGRKSLMRLVLPNSVFCGVLRCALQCEDITNRQLRWIADTAAEMTCP